MGDTKGDCEALMNATLPFAERMLAQYGEFYPFGAAMLTDGKIDSVAGYDGRKNPPSAEVIRLLKDIFAAGARDGQYMATALVSHVRVAVPPTGEKSDAIAVSLDHRNDYSAVVFYPYKTEDGKPVPGTPFGQKGDADIFPPK